MHYSTWTPILHLSSNSVKNYDWGSTDPNCYVCQLSATAPSPTAAQLWMGMHPKGESKLSNKQPISEYLEERKQQKLQFLFKVLSIKKCLSIQVHPNKEEAVRLNQKYGEIYVDNNDKPEMFFTLTNFQCFLGFICKQKFIQLMKIQPFSQWASEQMNIVETIHKILSLQQKKIPSTVNLALQNLAVIHPDRKDLYQRLNDQFPEDIGLVVSFLLQYWKIQPHKCFYIPCKTPHAYIKGQCLEIMKNSDNVIRMGLTPKLKDLKVLSHILQPVFNPIEEVIADKEVVYSSNSLHFRLIQGAAEFKVQVHQIGIVIEGKFSVFCSNSEKAEETKIQVKKGDIFLFAIGSSYHTEGSGLICCGWSTFTG